MNLTFRLRPFGHHRLVVILGAGLVVAVVAGAACGWLYENVALVVGFHLAVTALVLCAAVAGIAVAATAFRLRCRSRILLVAFTMIAGLAADGSSWAVAFRHARDHDLVWAESETDAFLRRTMPSKVARDVILGRHDIRTEAGRRAYAEMLSEPPPPERLSETVRAPTPVQYADFRLRRGWPERGHEMSGLLVALVWSGELVFLVLVVLWTAKSVSHLLTPGRCGVHGKPLAPVIAASVPDVDHVALAAAASRESIDEILAVPRWAGSGRVGRFDVRRCPEGDLATVSVTIHWKGSLLQRREVVVENAVIDGERADSLMRRLDGEGATIHAEPAAG